VTEVIKKLGLACVTSGLLVAAAALPSTASAQDYEWDKATPGDPPSGMECVGTSRSEVCFETEGDEIWVQDEKRDGRSALAAWAVDGRFGYCRNWSGYSSWAVCNKNFPEYTDVEFLAGTYNKSGPGPDDHIYWYWSPTESAWNTPD
jgi:hypothetical protein